MGSHHGADVIAIYPLLYERFGLRAPDHQWRWNLVLIPEWSPEFHFVHEVGA